MSKNINKPWGWYENLNIQEGYLVKKIFVKPNSKLSLQSHKFRSEHWVVVQGSARIVIDENSYDLGINESIYVPLGSKHRIENTSDKDLILIEVQIGDKLDEEDIYRYEDIYGRETKL
ncbi:MAG: Mannose-1-phosphate guanylyltransferase 1 [Alphaproteobacteria bacterium MarineAlpha5_Bin11]|nr:mannose-6-phosphate isomerase [Pelagibacteraceae bacterium]PPR42903.1 MAG: Mannose-1-phosphate guanylyltransferase 1 [Alphaproteobacteria bacterium MarineAlpha5_Bin11]PPR51558.1 MAG: Mannose-1-phosphate guanylyltransferase 1 [Alphaproteobacteria bacterium MarineAlpha5_Bin10]|tara:strand:+ start:3449 stop:3802 length:354 start_codon:yes stop_codon:yes gene_type:complete